MKKLMTIVAAIAMMTGSAYAAEWNFYGNARINTFWADAEAINQNDDSSAVLDHSLLGTSRIGANIKVSDELRARFEYGVTGAANGNDVARVRLLYGEWNFGAGSLTIGQDYGPVYMTYANQAYNDNGLDGIGDASSSREAMIKLKFGEFQIALIEPDTTDLNDLSNSANQTGYTAEVEIPTIAARYTYRFDQGNVRMAGAYNTYSLDDGAGTEYDVDSYVIGVGGQFNVGAFSLAGCLYGGDNAGHLINMATGSAHSGRAVYDDVSATNRVLDSDSMGFQFVVAYTINDMFSLEAGYGYVEEDVDTQEDNEAESYYVQCPIVMAPGVTVTPEVGIIDQEETGETETTYFGMKWQINF